MELILTEKKYQKRRTEAINNEQKYLNEFLEKRKYKNIQEEKTAKQLSQLLLSSDPKAGFGFYDPYKDTIIICLSKLYENSKKIRVYQEYDKKLIFGFIYVVTEEVIHQVIRQITKTPENQLIERITSQQFDNIPMNQKSTIIVPKEFEFH